jgi:DNA polymerase-3 subunit gamma/tau
MPLHLDYRPKKLNEVVGNDSIKESLETIFARKDKPHSYLFTGPSGCGKTTFGRIIRNMLGCSDSDFMELNTANSRGIDTVRELSQNCHYSPIDGDVKVYLLDECHQFTGPAAQALLKVLEDTPKHVYIILCTTEPDKLLRTIHTRCTTYQVKTLSNREIKSLLEDVLKSEKINDFSSKVLNAIINSAEGCPRQALVILDQVIDIMDEETALKTVYTVSFGEAEIIDICRALYKNEERWDTIKSKVKAVIENNEPESIRMAILGYMTSILLSKNIDDRASMIIDMFSENTFSSGKAGIVNTLYLLTKR